MWKHILTNNIKPVRVQCFVISNQTIELFIIDCPIVIILYRGLVSGPTINIIVINSPFYQLPRNIHPLFRIHQVNSPVAVTRSSRIGSCSRISNTMRTGFPFFRRDHDNAITRFCPVKSCCRSIFQHVNLFDVIRVQTRNRITQQVHEVQIVNLSRINIHRIGQNHPI